MKKMILTLSAFCLFQGVAIAQEAPQTPTGPDIKTYHGIQVPEPYAWLEKAKDPKVKAWINAQNDYAEKEMSSYPNREAIAKRIGELSLTAPTQFSPRIAGNTLLFMKDSPPSPQPVLMSQDWPGGREKALVNTNKDEHPAAITDFWPSPSGKYVAYGTAVGGSELTTIFFVETATGKKLKDVLPNSAGGTTPPSLVWDADEKGLTYVRLPKDSLFNASLYHHKLGDSVQKDQPAYGQGLSAVAEWELSSSPDGSMAAAMVHFGDGAPFRIAFRDESGWKMRVGPEADIRGGGRWTEEGLLAVSHDEAPRGEVRVYRPDGSFKVLLPEGQWAVKDVYPIKDGLLVARVWGEQQRMEHWSLSGKLIRVVPLPTSGIGLSSVAASSSSDDALITYTGWTLPVRWVSYNSPTGDLKTLFEIPTVGDFSQIEVTRTEAVSKDGSRIPLSIIHHKSVTPNGERPTILYAYGGFGVIQQPKFLGSTLAWLERGGVYAVANIRGGGEFGEPWHREGQKTNKQNCFDDFYACAETLHQAGWTNPDKLGIMGGSNGGLLVAASLVQHPDAFKAVVGLVGVYDSLGHETFPNGTYNIPEYGDSKVLEEFKAILAYSPLQNVKGDTDYPAVLLQTGENDLRVAPWQTRKFGAALQAASTSGEPILLVTQTNAGHGQGASFSQKVGKTALALSFFAHHLGLDSERK